jgi:hypothetical protein
MNLTCLSAGLYRLQICFFSPSQHKIDHNAGKTGGFFCYYFDATHIDFVCVINVMCSLGRLPAIDVLLNCLCIETLIDEDPIANIPPKIIHMREICFTPEELDVYWSIIRQRRLKVEVGSSFYGFTFIMSSKYLPFFKV